ncbi:MAG: S-layer homology domain-containing protein, partial [Fretibacterium sp.]|nr:S-layer homology domain-containing protein [Fretibacterium sp.]
MKKFVTAVAVVALVAFAAPVFAATNPFMDVPMNHWAYDAIGQLAAHGILSGYPDGTYKGKQPTTRYEMASALARALAVVDMTKASKQDVEMLQKLVVEFHDELEALGVRVDEMEGKVNLLDSRLGGWKLSGELRLDIANESINEPTTGDGSVKLSRARLHFDRWFGDPENPMHFRATLRGDNGNGEQGAQNWKQFYVEIPFFYDTLLTVGRSGGDFGADYYLGGTTGLPNTGGFAGTDSLLTDRDLDKLQVEKQFGMGKVTAYVAHPTEGKLGAKRETYSVLDTNNILRRFSSSTNYSAWELFMMGKFQFNEQFGFDLGGQAFIGDNAEDNGVVAGTGDASQTKFNNAWTIFAGLRFNFNPNVAFKGIFYHQKRDIDYWLGRQADPADTAWRQWDAGLMGYDIPDDSNHWRLIVDVKQEALKYTSLWLEYG